MAQNVPSPCSLPQEVCWTGSGWITSGFGTIAGHLGPFFGAVWPSLAPEDQSGAILNITVATDLNPNGVRGPNIVGLMV